ncbi:glycoside hydrolase family protein [Algoriphagus vanfongensis]|uniref:glycoside hydrolase family protein n=1 Tax=Algoriphagus vanfongensis TaxID=426371 RepID=UPI00047D40FB|nr:glycoside hydrolase family protein [Algoriphagus vanfongensis]
MMKQALKKGMLVLAFLIGVHVTWAQVTERHRPAAWSNLVEGGRFMDLFMPISPIGKLNSSTWGTAGVVPRYSDNGIEEDDYSYWGGNIIAGDDGKYHLFVCRWREDSPKGHWEWPNSIVVHAVSDKPEGPFNFVDEIGKGHNPEAYQAKNGDYIIYVIDGFYKSTSLNGPWEYKQFEFDTRDRPIIEGLSNLTFAQREDGSYLMVCRGGGVWFSQDGLSSYHQVSNGRVYPPVEGEFEDPVVWKDNVQYHLIVNDWLGRIAFYLRSKDGIHWKTDPGEAYLPGITVYEDGTKEDWFKYERIKIFQDEYGRAVQANFAVIDTLKAEDKASDAHSSKNIGIPLRKGLLLEVLNKKALSKSSKIRLLVRSEEGFDPFSELDLNSLRFGASEEVNFGRGASPIAHKEVEEGLEIIFDGTESGFTKENFAGKLIGKNQDGELVFGYSRLPGIDYTPAILTTRKPKFKWDEDLVEVVVENYGLSPSNKSKLQLEIIQDGAVLATETTSIKALKAYEEVVVRLPLSEIQDQSGAYSFKITILSGKQVLEVFEGGF